MQAVLLSLVALLLALPPARAEPAPTLHDTVAAAWALLPQRRDYAARQGVAAARSASGAALFPNAPALNGAYVNDRIAGSNYNYVTSQAELSTPIWLPGQGRATQNTARADADAIDAEAEAAHLALAGQVLDLVDQAALAVNARDVASRRVAAAQALATAVTRQFRVGEAAESDALAADADAESARITLIGAETQLATARTALAAITGHDAVPRLAVAAPGHAPPPTDALIATHPRLIAAQRAVDAAEASARLVRIENRDSPEVGVQGINEKQPGAKWDTRFGVTFRLPFATEARNAPRRAAAEQALTQAHVQLELARRDVLALIGQAEATLAGAERTAAVAGHAADELDRRRGQIERAWRVGEMSLIEVVRANSIAFDADMARDKARTELGAARERIRLAEGILP